MKNLELTYEQVQTKSQDAELRLEKAFDILFTKIMKAADVGSQNPQNYVRAGEVSVNV